MKIVAAAILLSFNLSLLAGTYHVAPSGNDAHGGAQEAPFQTLGRAVSAAAPGDTILMRGGKHSYAATVVIDKAGTSNSPIRLEAFPGERPVLDFSSWKPADEAARFDARGILLTTNARWWVLKGLEICYAPDAGVKSEGGHITFDQCVFHHNGDTAPFTLYNCLTVNCGKPYKLRQSGNTLKNCVDVKAAKPAPRDIRAPSTQENNTWNLGLVATEEDFISLTVADAGAPRQADGSLPNNGFARLKPGSKLIDRGVNVGLPFTGSAPDLGPYEFQQ
jgi:hypothetical protein